LTESRKARKVGEVRRRGARTASKTLSTATDDPSTISPRESTFARRRAFPQFVSLFANTKRSTRGRAVERVSERANDLLLLPLLASVWCARCLEGIRRVHISQHPFPIWFHLSDESRRPFGANTFCNFLKL